MSKDMAYKQDRNRIGGRHLRMILSLNDIDLSSVTKPPKKVASIQSCL